MTAVAVHCAAPLTSQPLLASAPKHTRPQPAVRPAPPPPLPPAFFSCRAAPPGEEVAIKFIQLGPRFYSKYVERELFNHRLLAHPHIVCFKEVGGRAQRGPGEQGGGQGGRQAASSTRPPCWPCAARPRPVDDLGTGLGLGMAQAWPPGSATVAAAAEKGEREAAWSGVQGSSRTSPGLCCALLRRRPLAPPPPGLHHLPLAGHSDGVRGRRQPAAVRGEEEPAARVGGALLLPAGRRGGGRGARQRAECGAERRAGGGGMRRGQIGQLSAGQQELCAHCPCSSRRKCAEASLGAVAFLSA